MRKVIWVKQEKAVTMIALVITIVILLILAGISIGMLTGENGILTKAIESREKTAEVEREEMEKIKEYENILNEIDNTASNNGKNESNNNQIYTIPQISNTSDPSVFASGYFNYGNGYYPSRAFDKITTGGGVQYGFNDSPWAQQKSGNVYVGYAYGIPVKVYKAEYTPRYDESAFKQNLHEYKYQYSDDFSTWEDATDIITLDTYNFLEPVVTEINDVGAHRFWRVYIISNHGDEYTSVNELQFYCTI